jgi:hypothetical protein
MNTNIYTTNFFIIPNLDPEIWRRVRIIPFVSTWQIPAPASPDSEN